MCVYEIVKHLMNADEYVHYSDCFANFIVICVSKLIVHFNVQFIICNFISIKLLIDINK